MHTYCTFFLFTGLLLASLLSVFVGNSFLQNQGQGALVLITGLVASLELSPMASSPISYWELKLCSALAGTEATQDQSYDFINQNLNYKGKLVFITSNL